MLEYIVQGLDWLEEVWVKEVRGVKVLALILSDGGTVEHNKIDFPVLLKLYNVVLFWLSQDWLFNFAFIRRTIS